MTAIRFFKTNNKADPGFLMATTEVADRFWASPEAAAWLAGPSGRLERLAVSWVVDNVGQWDNIEADWALIFDAVHAAMPREKLQ